MCLSAIATPPAFFMGSISLPFLWLIHIDSLMRWDEVTNNASLSLLVVTKLQRLPFT